MRNFQEKLTSIKVGLNRKVQKGKACETLSAVFESLVKGWQGSNGGRFWQGKQEHKQIEHQKTSKKGCIHLLRYIKWMKLQKGEG